MRNNLVVREDANELVLELMEWSLATLLITRLYLNITRAQITFGAWHIAHVLWGGLFMLIGLLMLVGFHGEKIKKKAIIFSGIGWGLFIDEIGKFITRNNDYWFQPAIIFIYISFILIFLVYRYFSRFSPKDPKAHLYQAISLLEEIAEGDLERKEKKSLLKKLDYVTRKGSEENKMFARELYQLIRRIKPIEDKKENTWEMLRKKVKNGFYNLVFKKRWVLNLLFILSIFYVISGIMDAIYLFPRFRDSEIFDFFYQGFDLTTRGEITLFMIKNLADIGTAILFGVGIYWVVKHKGRRGINYFQYGLLVNIFLASVFKFYFEQFSGVFSLALSIGIYYGLSELKKELKVGSK